MSAPEFDAEPPEPESEGEPIEPLTDDQAWKLDAEIRQAALRKGRHDGYFEELFKVAKASKIHKTLGFTSWRAYVNDVASTQSAGWDKGQTAAIKFLREQGMSIRAIAATLGMPRSTVADQVSGIRTGDNDAETITGLDGKTYPRERQQTPQTPQTKLNRVLARLCDVAAKVAEGVRIASPQIALIDHAHFEDLRATRSMLEFACQELDQLISRADSVEPQQH